ncbi:thiamine pyrophosphate-binding protein [Cryobacterium psychrophilum]
MALPEARLTGQPGGVMVTRGPCSANAAIAVHTAHQDQTSLLLMIGLVAVADRSRESFQEFDPHAWFGSAAKKDVDS